MEKINQGIADYIAGNDWDLISIDIPMIFMPRLRPRKKKKEQAK